MYRVDSDFYVEPKVIKECVEKCEKEGFDCVAVHNTSDPTVSFWAKVRKFERDMYKGDDLIVGARFWSRESFEDVKGFDEKMVACEDYDIHNRLLEKGFRIGRIESEEVHLGEPKSLKEVVIKSFVYGRSLRKVKKDQQLRKQLSPFRKAFIKNTYRFILHPVLGLGLILMNFLKYLSFCVGILNKK